MIGRIITALLLATLMTGCMGYKMGDVLTKASTTVSQQPTVSQAIGVTVNSEKITLQDVTAGMGQVSKSNLWAIELSQVSSQVFSRYGWKTTQSTSTPVAVKLTISRNGYVYPGSFLLYLVGIGTLPVKGELYYTVKVEVVVNGVEQEHLTYTGNVTNYMTCYGPISLMMPGVTHREFGISDDSPDELRGQVFVQIMEHIAEDIKARYYTGNHQMLAI